MSMYYEPRAQKYLLCVPNIKKDVHGNPVDLTSHGKTLYELINNASYCRQCDGAIMDEIDNAAEDKIRELWFEEMGDEIA